MAEVLNIKGELGSLQDIGNNQMVNKEYKET